MWLKYRLALVGPPKSEWLWGSALNREFVQVEGMHELNVSPPSLQNNVTIVGTSELTTEVQIALENLFESKTL